MTDASRNLYDMLKLNTLQEKPWHIQLAVFGALALVLYAGFWYLVTKDTRAQTRETDEKVAGLVQANARAQIASQRLSEFKVALVRAQQDYDEVKALLPEQRELTIVLQGVQDRARGQLSLRRFTPREDIQQDHYSGKPIEVEVSGSYNKLGVFFAQMAAYQRIVSISDFKIKQSPDQRTGRSIDSQFILTAYYASPEKLVSAAKLTATTPAAKATPAVAKP
ncbi:MAG: type 4a pilus biogenesis protein PilO [Acidobacteriota bacterium]|nr:type 4a pilus biogenesis protein PilO [Acidobacteriota bacterium]